MATPDGNAAGVIYARFPVTEMAPRGATAPRLTPIDPAAGERYQDPHLARIAPFVDVAWYRTTYPDIAAADLDPVEHYGRAGWREGRRPNASFDPRWYAEAYADIGAAGMDPLLHYVTAGFAEGRRATRPGDLARSVVETTRRHHAHVPSGMAPPDAVELDALALRRLIAERSLGAAGLVVSASHDRYLDVTGGIELVIADEQRLFAAACFTYLHLSPVVPAMTLLPDPGAPMLLQLVIDGAFVGLATSTALREALAAEAPRLPARRIFVVHSFFGHRAADLISLAAAMAATTRLIWLHDYGALCEGFNLLRNGIEYCGAPPPDSHACMVCLHGPGREAYLRRVRRLYAMLNPIVVAPSNSAMALFEARSDLPHLRRIVHPNASLAMGPVEPTPRPALGTAEDPVRVAFAGYRLGHKGWHSYLRLVAAMEGNPGYRFHHFATAKALDAMHGLTGVTAQASPDNRLAMRESLAEHRIDLVLVLSPWPETFSFVTYEAITAGADVICLVVGGNAAAAVRRNERGVVLQDEYTLLRFFTSGAALAYVRAMAAAGRQGGVLRMLGTSATLDPEGETGQPAELATTATARLRLLVGGRVLVPEFVEGRHRFELPPGSGVVRLRSRRSLEGIGALVGGVWLDGAPVALDDARLGAGWGALAEGARPSLGDAELDVGGALCLELGLRPGPDYPRLPLAGD